MQIQLKSEDKNLISKFFSPKQVKGEPKLKQEDESSHHDSVKTSFPKGLKEEPKDEEFEDPSPTESKPNIAELPEDSTENYKVKRDHEKSAAVIECEKHHESPVKKKKREVQGAAGDKQSTLFSYFGKS